MADRFVSGSSGGSRARRSHDFQDREERKAILERLNNQGRRLEKQSPVEALELNARLEEVAKWLKTRLPRK
jgi:hypothetical protein